VVLNELVIFICFLLNANPAEMQQGYFSSPEESVKVISMLLISEDWTTLSSYYYLADSNRDLLDSLLSGDYFIRKDMPETAHPGGFWKYRHPFPPGFTYFSHEQLTEDRIKVNLVINIDQGDGMVQTGKASFLLKKFPEGYKILPEQPPEETNIF
jgi:hypothetical protein